MDGSMTNIELIERLKAIIRRQNECVDWFSEAHNCEMHRAAQLESHLSAIREAVEKLKAGGSTIAFFATLYELDAINPAPPAPKEK